MRQFLMSAGRTIFKNRGLYVARRPGYDQQRGVTQSSTRDHPIEEPKMSGWEQTKEKISNKGKAGFGSDTKPVEMPIVERARVKGADRQASQHQRTEAMGNANLKTTLQDDMNAGIGINQSDATADKKWTETAKEQTRDLKSNNKNRDQEQLMRDIASGRMNPSPQSKEWQELAEKQRRADERAAKYPNMPKQESKQTFTPEKEHHENDKITDVINEEHGIPEVGEKKPRNTSPGFTDAHEQHGARLKGDDMVFEHQPKMRFDPARSYAENAEMSSEQLGKSSIKNTADHQRMEKEGSRMADSMRQTGQVAADWIKEKLGSDPAQQRQQTIDAKARKAEGKQEAVEAEGKVQPQMRGEFGIPSGSPVGEIKNPEKRSRINPEKNTTELKH